MMYSKSEQVKILCGLAELVDAGALEFDEVTMPVEAERIVRPGVWWPDNNRAIGEKTITLRWTAGPDLRPPTTEYIKTRGRKRRPGFWLVGLLFVFALMLCESVQAASVMGGGVSTHLITSDDQYTNTHDMVGVELGSVMAVRFRNSYGQESYAVAYRAEEWRRGNWRARLYVGGVRGYDLCEVCPAAVLTLVYDKYWIKPGVLLLGEALALYAEVEL